MLDDRALQSSGLAYMQAMAATSGAHLPREVRVPVAQACEAIMQKKSVPPTEAGRGKTGEKPGQQASGRVSVSNHQAIRSWRVFEIFSFGFAKPLAKIQ